jgi:hypothetical protein
MFHYFIETSRNTGFNMRYICVIKRSYYSDSLRAGGSGNRIPVRSRISRTRPYRPWDPRSRLSNVPGLFTGGKAAGNWHFPPTSCRAEVKKEHGCTSVSFVGLHDLFYVNVTFVFYLCTMRPNCITLWIRIRFLQPEIISLCVFKCIFHTNGHAYVRDPQVSEVFSERIFNSETMGLLPNIYWLNR